MGNADRTLIDGRLGSMFDWATTQVTEDDKDFLRGFEPAIAIDDVLYCHSTPTSDEEWITILTPEYLADEILGEVGYPTLVQGHTHTQFDRRIGETRVVNAGSVGMPNADEPGAYWLLVEDGEPEHRRTAYDVDAAAARLRESEWPLVDEWLAERVVTPLSLARRHGGRGEESCVPSRSPGQSPDNRRQRRAGYQAATAIGTVRAGAFGAVPSVIVQVGPLRSGLPARNVLRSQP